MATFYVCKSGCNTNDGSLKNPFLEISHAAALVNPGDTVIVMPGVYNETVHLTRPGKFGATINFRAHPDYMAKDLLQKHKNFDAATSAGVVVTGISNPASVEAEGNGFNITASYQRVEGFFVTAPQVNTGIPVKIRRPNESEPPHSNIEIIDNVVYNGSEAGINSENAYNLTVKGNIVFHNASTGVYEGSGISVGFNHIPYKGDNANRWQIIVDSNICYNNAGYDIGRRKSLRNVTGENLPHGNNPDPALRQLGSTDGNGIIIDWAHETPTLVRNNIVYNNGGRGICLTSSSNVAVVNNTSYDNAWDPYQFYHLADYDDYTASLERGGNGNIFVNNIVYTKNDGVVGVRAKIEESFQGYNLYFNGRITENSLHESDIVQDPLFVNPPLLIGEGCRPVIKKSSNRLAGFDWANAYPLEVYHYFDVDFALQADSKAIGSGYVKDADDIPVELRHRLDDALPEYDVYGKLRNPGSMDMGAVAFTAG